METEHYSYDPFEDEEDAGEDIGYTRKRILMVSGWLLFFGTLAILLAYRLSENLRMRPGNLLVPYLLGNLFLAIHWIAHPFYTIPDQHSTTCFVVGIITVANEQLLRCYEASIFYALWKIYRVRGANTRQEIEQRQNDFQKINWQFHLFSLFGASYLTIMLLLIESPGRDYYNFCTLQWIDETEKGPMMIEVTIYFWFCAYNIFLCCDVWCSQRQQINRIDQRQVEIVQPQEQAEIARPREQIEIEHFQKMLKWYLFWTTLFGTVLTLLNIYAAYETEEVYRYESIIIIHDIAVIAQPLLIIILKFSEAPVREGITAFGSEITRIWNLVKGFMRNICGNLMNFCTRCLNRQHNVLANPQYSEEQGQELQGGGQRLLDQTN